MAEHRTGIQRRTLAAALLLASVAGAGTVALVSDTDEGNSRRISDTIETTTSEAPTTEAPTTVLPAPPETAAPAPVPLEARVDDHEERIDSLEATTTLAPPTTAAPTTTTSTTTPPPTTCPSCPG